MSLPWFVAVCAVPNFRYQYLSPLAPVYLPANNEKKKIGTN